MFFRRRAFALILALPPAFACAHHGTRFILAVEYDMVRQPFAFVTGTYEQFRHEDNDIEYEPALLFPVGKNGLSEFELHGHFDQPGSEPLRHEATGFELRHRFTRQPGWNFAAGVEYETTVPNIEDPNNWTATFVVGKEDRHGMILLNLLDEVDAVGGKELSNWGYRAAYSPTPEDLLNYSLEFQGDLKSHGSHEVVVGVMQHLDLNTMIKVGVGTGLTSNSPSFTFRIGLVRALGGIE